MNRKLACSLEGLSWNLLLMTRVLAMDWTELYVSLSGLCSSLTLHNYCCFVAISNYGQKISKMVKCDRSIFQVFKFTQFEEYWFFFIIKRCVVLSFVKILIKTVSISSRQHWKSIMTGVPVSDRNEALSRQIAKTVLTKYIQQNRDLITKVMHISRVKTWFNSFSAIVDFSQLLRKVPKSTIVTILIKRLL